MYTERASTDSLLKSSIQAIWHSALLDGDRSLVVPDAATDIIIKTDGTRLEIGFCGTMTKAMPVTADKDTHYWGLRFKPGHGSLFFDFPMHTANNELVDISQNFEKNRINDLMEDPVRNSFCIEKIMTNLLLKRLHQSGYRKDLATINLLAQMPFGKITTQAQQLGISRRHMNRIFKSYFGYSARESSRIFKFKKLTENMATHPNASLSDLAVDSGFYDQSDMNNCVRDLCDMTPKALMSHLSNI